MKATNKIMKSVTTLAVLGVILAGCSGGSEPTASRSNSPINTNPQNSFNNSTLPGTVSGGSGTVGMSGNDVIDTVNTKIDALNAKLDETLAEAKSANSNSKKAKNKLNWVLPIVAGMAGLMAIERFVTGWDASAAAGGNVGKGILAGLANDKTGREDKRRNEQTEVINGNVDAAQAASHQDSLALARGVKSEGGKTRSAVNAQGNRNATLTKGNMVVTAKVLAEQNKQGKALAQLDQKSERIIAGTDKIKSSVASLETEVRVTLASTISRVATVESDTKLLATVAQKLDAEQKAQGEVLTKQVELTASLNSALATMKTNFETLGRDLTSLKASDEGKANKEAVAALEEKVNASKAELDSVQVTIARLNEKFPAMAEKMAKMEGFQDGLKAGQASVGSQTPVAPAAKAPAVSHSEEPMGPFPEESKTAHADLQHGE